MIVSIVQSYTRAGRLLFGLTSKVEGRASKGDGIEADRRDNGALIHPRVAPPEKSKAKSARRESEKPAKHLYRLRPLPLSRTSAQLATISERRGDKQNVVSTAKAEQSKTKQRKAKESAPLPLPLTLTLTLRLIMRHLQSRGAESQYGAMRCLALALVLAMAMAMAMVRTRLLPLLLLLALCSLALS